MKSSLEELLRDLQIISKELFLSSWNLVSTTNLNTVLLYMCGYFTSTTWWKCSLFIQFPCCRNPSLRHFVGYSFGASRKKVSTIFYGTAKNKASTVSYRAAKDKSGRPCQRAWLFHLHSMVRVYRFFFTCSVYGFMAEAFYWFLWSFKEKASTIFYGTAKNKARTVSYRTAKDKSGRTCQRAWLFHLHSMVRTYRFFFSCSVYGLYGWGILLLILLGLKKAVS